MTVSEHAVRSFRPFKKRTATKIRIIDNPNDRLKHVQRLIDRKLLKSVVLPDYLHGSITGRSSRSNATRHLQNHCVVRIDIRDFFPSVSDRAVYRIWIEQFGFGPRVAGLLTTLTTFRGRLPQGAPTSSGLANLVLLEADRLIHDAAESEGLIYTRFVDDLIFSGRDPRPLIGCVIRALQRSGFRVSHKKLAIMGPHELQEVTGLAVNSGRVPSVPRSKRDRIRAAIHELALDAEGIADERRRRSIRGRINSLASTNPGARRRLNMQWDVAVLRRPS